MSSILIKDALIVSPHRISKGNIYVEDNIIIDCNSPQIEAEFVIEDRSLVVTPGFVNSHTHISMSIMRGFLDDLEFRDFIEKTCEIDSRMGEKDIELGAYLGIIEMLRNGITLFFDMYYGEDIIAKVAEDLGIRAALGWAVVDENKTTQKDNPLRNAEKFIANFSGKDRIYPMVAPHGVYSCNSETLLAAKEISERYGVPIHMHVAESREEVYDHYKRHGNRVVEYLKELGILSERFIAVHCVWLTLREIRMLAEARATVVHCPSSNMKLGIGGESPVPEMLEHGVNLCIGTDSATTNNTLDIFQEMRISCLLHKNWRWSASTIKAEDIFRCATENGYKAIGLKGGRIEENYLADLCILDGREISLQPLTPYNALNNIVYSATGRCVKYTIVDGRIINIDEKLNKVIDRLEESEVLKWLIEKEKMKNLRCS